MTQHQRWFRDQDSFGVHDAEGEVIARNLYRDVENGDGTKQRVFPGVFVYPDHRGAGLAGKLTKYSIDTSLDEGYRIVPVCPYVARWVREYNHGAYLPHRDEPSAEHFHAD